MSKGVDHISWLKEFPERISLLFGESCLFLMPFSFVYVDLMMSNVKISRQNDRFS